MLPIEPVDLTRFALDTPCLRTWAAIMIHISDAHAAAALRPLVHELGSGTLSDPAVRRHVSYALARRNFKITHVEHLHRVFTVPKRNGELRMIIDATDAHHPNAFNERLPAPPPPPAMLRVPTVVATVLSGDEIGVDDVMTAFATMPMCRTMFRALGLGVPASKSHPEIVAAHARVPQGGTWSAVLCQGHTLTAVVPPEEHPPTMARPIAPLGRPHLSGLPAADWIPVLRRLGIVIHVDDVITSGVIGTVDDRRRCMRVRTENRYGMRWKPFQQSSPRAEALGMDFDAENKSWALQRKWINDFELALEGWQSSDDGDVDWARGCTAWIIQVLHTPLALLRTVDESWPRRIRQLLHTRATYAESMSLCMRLSPWPRPARRHHVQLTDACGYAWAGAALDCGLGIAGRWHRCTSGALSPWPCCGASDVRVGPEEMVMAEALASVATFLRIRRCEGTRDTLILSDNESWTADVAASRGGTQALSALTVLMWLLADGQLASAHVRGDENSMDGPSRLLCPPILSCVPPHTHPQWSTIGVARVCRHVASPLWESVCLDLPCCLRAVGDTVVATMAEVCLCAVRPP